MYVVLEIMFEADVMAFYWWLMLLPNLIMEDVVTMWQMLSH